MAADGDVTYDIRGDDSKLDSDLDAANKKVERAAKETGQKREQVEGQTSREIKKEQESVTQHHKQQNEERLKDDKQTGEERVKNEQSVSGSIKEAIQSAVESSPIGSAASKWTDGFTGAKAAALGVGAGLTVVGGKAVSVADEMNQAMNGYLAATGKSQDETERYQQVLERIYANNYGESFEDIADAMAQVNHQLGDMPDEQLQSVTESAFALRDVFEYDVSESTRAAKALMDNFGVSGDEAMNLIAAGAQNGLDYSGELLDSISEYSVQFAKVGLDADDMFQIFQRGAETGAWNLDKIGDAVKEMSIRVVDGSDTTAAGFEAIGLDADEMAAKFAAGGETAREAFGETVEALAEMEDPMEQNAAGVALFGTMWEDLGPEVVTQLADITDGAYAAGDELEAMKDVNYDDLGSMIDGLKRNLELLLVPLGNMLIPILQLLIESVLPVLTGLLTPLMEAIMALLEPILSLISQAIQPLIDIISLLADMTLRPLIELLKTLPEIFKSSLFDAFESAKRIIGNIQGVFQGIIDFIVGVFTGDWGRAWEGVKSIFSNIAEGIGNVFKAPINFIIGCINSFIRGLNKIKIPDWVPGIGGAGFHISEIPKLKRGMDFVPTDDFPAFLHYGERVMTREENAEYMAAGGLNGLAALDTQGPPVGPETSQEARFDIYLQLDGRTIARRTARYTGEQLSWEEL